MSWLSAVTGKAEDFLNKLDRSAADVLHADEIKLKEKPKPPPEPTLIESAADTAIVTSLSPSLSVPARLYSLKNETERIETTGKGTQSTNFLPNPLASAQSSGKPVKKKNSDEALFDFLNSKESEAGKKRTPTSSHHHSRQSSTSSIISSTSKGAKFETIISDTPTSAANIKIPGK